MWCPQCSGKLGIWKRLHSAEYCIILILSGEKNIWTLLCKLWILLWHYIPHISVWSACGTLYYYNELFIVWGEIKQFLTNLCDLTKISLFYMHLPQLPVSVGKNCTVFIHFCGGTTMCVTYWELLLFSAITVQLLFPTLTWWEVWVIAGREADWKFQPQRVISLLPFEGTVLGKNWKAKVAKSFRVVHKVLNSFLN